MFNLGGILKLKDIKEIKKIPTLKVTTKLSIFSDKRLTYIDSVDVSFLVEGYSLIWPYGKEFSNSINESTPVTIPFFKDKYLTQVNNRQIYLPPACLKEVDRVIDLSKLPHSLQHKFASTYLTNPSYTLTRLSKKFNKEVSALYLLNWMRKHNPKSVYAKTKEITALEATSTLCNKILYKNTDTGKLRLFENKVHCVCGYRLDAYLKNLKEHEYIYEPIPEENLALIGIKCPECGNKLVVVKKGELVQLQDFKSYAVIASSVENINILPTVEDEYHDEDDYNEGEDDFYDEEY